MDARHMVPNHDPGLRCAITFEDADYVCRVVGFVFEAFDGDADEYVDPVIIYPSGVVDRINKYRLFHVDDEGQS